MLQILSEGWPLAGNQNCWFRDYTYENCCSLNNNLDRIPDYEQLVWLLLLAERPSIPRRRLHLVQGGVLENWQKFKRYASEGGSAALPAQQFYLGEGLLWSSSAFSVDLMEFPFHVDASRRFLELASGTGAPSLVALARGFEVWSTDLFPGSAWQRRASAESSFGAGSAELRRLHTPVLDLLNDSSWPSPALLFDAVFMAEPTRPGLITGPAQERQVVRTADRGDALCDGFREIVRRFLRGPLGVGIYARRMPIGIPDLSTLPDYHCMKPDRHHAVTLHQQAENGTWWSQRIFEDQPAGLQVVAPGLLREVFEIRKLPPATMSSSTAS